VKTLRTIVQLAIAFSFVAVLSAAPGQVPEFRMAAQIDHFDITCAPELDRQALSVGRQAETAYQRVSSSLQRDLSFRPLLVLFPTSADQTRAIDTRTIPGNREHVLVTLDTPENRIEGQFIHELSHVFLFDALPPAQHRNVPVWILEGLAEHQRGEWNAGDRAALRNMVDRGTLPKLSRAGTLEGDARTSTIFGHAAFDFLAAREGTGGVRRFFDDLREGAPVTAFLRGLALPPADFDHEFDAYLSRLF
jgi:hypothetical protein